VNGNTEQAILLKGMTGSTSLINFGGQIEFSFFSPTGFRLLEPYFSIGGFYTIYDAEVKSAFGDIEENINFLPVQYQSGLFLDKDNASSFSLSVGTRYHLNENLKTVIDLRYQRFLSDKIDGLEPQISSNKFRDWLLFLNIGIVFNLN
jgi:opacity protein-like surface antigen